MEHDVGGGVGEERAGAGLPLAAVDLVAVQGMLAIVGDEGQVDGDAERPLAVPAEGPGQVGAEGGIDLGLELLEAEELGVEGVGVGLLAGGVAEPAAGLGDLGDPLRRGEEDGQEDRGGDFALAAEVEVRLAEVEGEAVDLGGCQGGGGLAHSGLRDVGFQHKSLSEICLSRPSPATCIIRKSGKY